MRTAGVFAFLNCQRRGLARGECRWFQSNSHRRIEHLGFYGLRDFAIGQNDRVVPPLPLKGRPRTARLIAPGHCLNSLDYLAMKFH